MAAEQGEPVRDATAWLEQTRVRATVLSEGTAAPDETALVGEFLPGGGSGGSPTAAAIFSAGLTNLETLRSSRCHRRRPWLAPQP
jgi:hypothetical protein